jgi:hypothetical protein
MMQRSPITQFSPTLHARLSTVPAPMRAPRSPRRAADAGRGIDHRIRIDRRRWDESPARRPAQCFFHSCVTRAKYR